MSLPSLLSFVPGGQSGPEDNKRGEKATRPLCHDVLLRCSALSKCEVASSPGICDLLGSEENKEHPKTQHTRKRRSSTVSRICVFGCVAFSGALCSPLRGRQNTPENTTHPKTQHTRKRSFWEQSVTRVFGCVAFSGVFWRLPIGP